MDRIWRDDWSTRKSCVDQRVTRAHGRCLRWLVTDYLTVKAPTRRSQQLDSGQRGAIIILVVIWVVSALLVGPIVHVRHVHIVDLSIDQVSSSRSRPVAATTFQRPSVCSRWRGGSRGGSCPGAQNDLAKIFFAVFATRHFANCTKTNLSSDSGKVLD